MNVASSGRLATLAPLPCGLFQRIWQIISVKHEVDFIIPVGLAVECCLEMVSPLGTGYDPLWLVVACIAVAVVAIAVVHALLALLPCRL